MKMARHRSKLVCCAELEPEKSRGLFALGSDADILQRFAFDHLLNLQNRAST